jgi:hypothetical protein
MMNLTRIQEELRRHRLEVVAAETGLSYNTVRRYASGVVGELPEDSRRIPLSWRLISEWLEQRAEKTVAAATQ